MGYQETTELELSLRGSDQDRTSLWRVLDFSVDSTQCGSDEERVYPKGYKSLRGRSTIYSRRATDHSI